MNSIDVLPDVTFADRGRISRKFLSLKINTLHDACRWVKRLPYGYNSFDGDSMLLFEEGMGTCMSKHGAIAELAEEIGISLHKYVGFYKLDDEIIDGIQDILTPFGLRYIPQMHCVLGSHSCFVDLTEGNCHGKKKDILDMDLFVRAPANLTKGMKEDLYIYGLQYFKNADPDLKKHSDAECLLILKKCNDAHKNYCSLL